MQACRGWTASIVITTVALLAAGCGPQAEVTVDTHADALTAIADSFSESWSFEARFALDIDEEDHRRFSGHEQAMLRDWQEDAADARVIGALAEDGSWRTAFVDEDTTYLDVRLDVADLLSDQTLEPDAAVYVRLDIPYVLREWAWILGASTPEQLSRNVSRWLGGSPFEPVLLAIVDGGWGGVSGPLDLEAWDASDDDSREAHRELRDDVIDVADRDAMLGLLDEATTLRDFAPAEDGGSTATLDVHPRAAALAADDLVDDADHPTSGPTSPKELPETLAAVATVTFDRTGTVAEVSVDVLAVARELHADDPTSGADELAELSDASTFEVVLAFADHGQVPTVLDVPDAVTTSWDELAEAFAALWQPRVHGELSEDIVVEERLELEAEATPPPDGRDASTRSGTRAPEPGADPSSDASEPIPADE